MPWKVAINRAARGLFAEWDLFGFLFDVYDDALWALLNTPPRGVMRDRSDFSEPAALAAGADAAARDAFKRVTESRAAWYPMAHGEWFHSILTPPHRLPYRPLPLPLQTRKVIDSKARSKARKDRINQK